MTYALRKLIAFVFLGGMFWFLYQDLGNIDKPWFMHAFGVITVAFAVFWLLIPIVVVGCRIRRRRALNKERYQKWLEEGGLSVIKQRPVQNGRLTAMDQDERVFFHEKGTLYIDLDASGVDAAARPVGRPSDVAFPGWRRKCHVCQRTHCYFTNRRIVFEGKNLDISIVFANLVKRSATPGGMVFETWDARFAFTFQNPMIAFDVLDFAKRGAERVGGQGLGASAPSALRTEL